VKALGLFLLRGDFLRGLFMGSAMLLMVFVGLLLYIIPPAVILLATVVWRGKWLRQAWLPVPVFVAAFWLLSVYAERKPDLDGGEVFGMIAIGGGAVLYYRRLYHQHRREQQAILSGNPATSAH
jgi:hypothetical protein